MRKPYTHLYTSSALFLFIGFQLTAMDLVIKSQGKFTSLLSLVDLGSQTIQAGLFLMAVGVYHLILGVKVDKECQLDHKEDLLDKNLS